MPAPPAERFRRLEELFEVAIATPREQRAAFLDQACGTDLQLRAEIDALYLHLYGFTREEAKYVLDTFSVLRGKEESNIGEYRTRNQVMAFFDSIQRSKDTGELYRSGISPEPGKGPRHSTKTMP